jgi:succinate dehydrogenase/fumarate reductase flavoprotein subunit
MRNADMKNRSNLRVITRNTIVVGTGAAGFNAADRLYQYGQKDIAIVTEGINVGTSRNTGSDKQTYYKLTLAGGEQDSVREMAETLFEGQCVDGDIALCEAALSAQSFLRLAELGVPFPKNRYGEYIGYKTDHDPRRRATSVGPYTSKVMTEVLEREAREKNIDIYDRMQVIRILSDGNKVYGIICLDLEHADDENLRFAAFCCKNIIFATGGPAGMYANSVYPRGHYGATGLAFEAGAKGRNLTEWQYGLASVSPRWNVSGTYMQVLPRLISTKEDGSDEREFLYDFFEDEGEMLTKVFLKGYQWPFDVRKVENGSSIIDILVYLETAKGRKVYLDFTENPGKKEIDYHILSDEAREYLQKAGACFGTPYDRLMHMNAPAVAFYKDRNVDLSKMKLEIALCAQHNNGGLAVDCWWQTNLQGLFAVGEVAASHGVYRPGGSALNAGQVGSTRAAQYVAAKGTGAPDLVMFRKLAEEALSWAEELADHSFGSKDTLLKYWKRVSERMSNVGAAIRNEKTIRKTVEELRKERMDFFRNVRVAKANDIKKVFRLYEFLLCQQVYLESMLNYIEQGGKSRGSALYTDAKGKKPYAALPDEFIFRLDDGKRSDMIQEILFREDYTEFFWRKVNPIPEDDDFFENVWRSFRENGNIF